MKAIELWDSQKNIFLTLREVLAPIAADCSTSNWEISSHVDPTGENFFWLGGDGDDAFDAIADTGRRLPGPEFLALAERTSQVIWGVFRGYDEGAENPWIVLQAIDSSFWRCDTRDIQTRQALMRTFKGVRLRE